MPQIRGAFPLPTYNLPEGTNRITLASGALFYMPSGNYIMSTDANTIIEVWDPIETVWRTWITASNSESVYADGYNFRARNTTGAVSSTTIGNAGSGMTNGIGSVATGVSLSVAAAPTGFPTATLYPIVGGSVQAPTVAQAGSGFLTQPLVVIDPPPAGGIQATAVAALTSGGGIASITMVNVGAGYTASPNFWLIPQSLLYQGAPSGGNAAGPITPGGLVFPGNAVAGNQNTSSTGAQLVSNALTGSGTLTGAIIIVPGGGYTTASPTVTISGGAGGVAVTATVGNTTPANSLLRSQPRVQ